VTTTADITAYLAKSTRGPGKCLGTVGNDMTGHFGSYGVTYYSAKTAADSLARSGELHSGPCPTDPHFDFYDYVEGGVNYGHIDYHVPALGIHYANSSRCTVWLNPNRTVGTYPSWGGARRGWSYRPGAGDTMPKITVSGAAPAQAHPATPATGKVVMPTRVQWMVIQAGMKRRRRYAGVVDGVPGPLTWKGVQLTVRSGGGYSGPIDGVPGHYTWLAVQRYAWNWGGYRGPIDGVPGFNTWEGFARGVK